VDEVRGLFAVLHSDKPTKRKSKVTGRGREELRKRSGFLRCAAHNVVSSFGRNDDSIDWDERESGTQRQRQRQRDEFKRKEERRTSLLFLFSSLLFFFSFLFFPFLFFSFGLS
jgi:hypothetical protein